MLGVYGYGPYGHKSIIYKLKLEAERKFSDFFKACHVRFPLPKQFHPHINSFFFFFVTSLFPSTHLPLFIFGLNAY